MKVTILENTSNLTGEEIATFASDYELEDGTHTFSEGCGLNMTGSFTITTENHEPELEH